MLTDAIVTINVISSLGLILLVLLHSGKGGGLSSLFGGGVSSIASGSSVVEKNLDRMTIICLALFAFTTIIVGLRWT